MIALRLGVCCALFAGAAGAQPGPKVDTLVDYRAVRAVAAAIIAADNGRDINRVLALYTPDAVLLPPSDEPVVGRAAIRPRYEALFKTMNPAIRSEVTDVHVSGAWAFLRGRNTGELRPVDASVPPRTLNDLFLMVLTRSASGQWQIARLMWHSGAIEPRTSPT